MKTYPLYITVFRAVFMMVFMAVFRVTPSTYAGEPITAPSAIPSTIPSAAPSVIPSAGDLMNLKPLPGRSESSLETPEHPIDLTLKSSIDQAIHNSTLTLKAGNDFEYTGDQLLQAYAQFLPNLGVSGTYGYQAGNIYFTSATPTDVVTRNSGATYQVSSTLNLFNGLSDFSSLKSSIEKKRASMYSLARAKQQITLDITQSYFQVILDQDVVGIAQKNLTVSQQRQVLLEEQTQVGVKSLADLFRQQAQTSADETYLINSKIKARNDQLVLIQKLRLDAALDYTLDRPPNLKEFFNSKYDNEAHLVNLALDQRTDLKASESTLSATQWGVVQARSGYYPRIDLGFNLYSSGKTLFQQDVDGVPSVPTYQGSPWSQLGTQSNYTIGLTLSWGLFDRFVTRLATQKMNVISNNSEIDFEDRKLQVISEVRQAYGQYRAAFSQLESSRKGLAAATKAYEVMTGRYEVGSANFIDLITTQTSLVQAQSTWAQAVINYQLQGDQMEYSLGTL